MYPTTMNFAKVNEVPIVIIYTKFGEDRSISLVSAGSRISPLCLHLTTSHYNIACTTVQLVKIQSLSPSCPYIVLHHVVILSVTSLIKL